ncbi:MAG: tRNA (adenosine(37)-N6)-threonylcarbamoyltransferase complex ATPase subunit type 1 TsaE [Candidatus Omnitrophica bacterium]|nr:tRNA (adenosine(37)-N6)-threonylcarbamoyltransferase complex ATPase subunit type 1 TsaE [Candidatus Omnitrophota bacterium]
MLKLKSNSANQTINFGKLFSKILKGGDTTILEGALGGGKTTFTKGILAGLGYRKRVRSPSFTLLRQYDLKKISVYHLDLYRLEFSDIFDLGIDDFLYSERIITLIEWGNKMKQELDKYIKVEFVFSRENIRNIKFSVKGYPDKVLETLNKIYKKYV